MRVWRNSDDVRWWFKTTDIISREQQMRWYESYPAKENDFVFMVFLNGNSEYPIGQASVYNIDGESGEIGRFVVNPNERNKGYMTLACQALIELCRRNLCLKKLCLEVLKNNSVAIKINVRCGFRIVSECEKTFRMELNEHLNY